MDASSVSPRYLKLLTHFIFISLILSSGRMSGIFFINIMALGLLRFRVSSHLFVQSTILFIICFILSIISAMVFPVTAIAKSSAS